MTQQWHRIPHELRKRGQWCVAAPDKRPVTPNGYPASSTDPSTWTDFTSACMAASDREDGAGIGFVLCQTAGLTCIDLDIKANTPPEWRERFERIIQQFDSYTERSKSGLGFHIWVKGIVPDGCRRDGVEVYSDSRFMISTGDVVRDAPIREAQDLLDLLYMDIRRAQSSNTALSLGELDSAMERTVQEVYERCMGAANADKFKTLWEGKWQELGYPSQSEADAAFCQFVFFAGATNDQCLDLFKLSNLSPWKRPVEKRKSKPDYYAQRTMRQARVMLKHEAEVAAQAQASAMAIAATATAKMEKAARVERVEREEIDLQWPPGNMGKLAQWMMTRSVRPIKPVAIATALAAVAGLHGGRFYIGGSLLNMYITIICDAGMGKGSIPDNLGEFYQTLARDYGFYDAPNHYSTAYIASEPALLKLLVKQPTILNHFPEMGTALREMAKPTASVSQGLLRQYLQLAQMRPTTIHGGLNYSKEESNVESVVGPAFSMIGESTHSAFQQSMNTSLFENGFIPRLLMFQYNGDIPPLSSLEDRAIPFPEDVASTLKNGASLYQASSAARANTLRGPNEDRAPAQPYRIEVKATPEAQALLDEYGRECDRQYNTFRETNKPLSVLWGRVHMKSIKVAALCATIDNSYEPVITEDHARWALHVVRDGTLRLADRFIEGEVGTDDSAKINALKDLIQRYMEQPLSPSDAKKYGQHRAAGIIPRDWLRNRATMRGAFKGDYGFEIRAFDGAVRELIAGGTLTEVSKLHPVELPKAGTCYFVTA